MQNNPLIKVQLKEAYQYIKDGQRAAALKILAPICKNDPTNATAWWLAAHAFNDDDHIQYALQQVLSIDPNFPGAANKLSRLRSSSPVRPKTTPIQRQATKAPPKKQNDSSFGWILGLTVILIAIVIGGTVIFVLQRNNNTTQQSSQAVVEIQDTTTPVNTAIPIPTTSIPIPPTLPPENTPTPIPPSFTPTTRPPTRTPRPTSTPIPTLIIPATEDPGVYGETYWEGDGNGPNMETYVNSRGRYIRFYRFPVLVYVIGGETQLRRNAVNGALKEINQVVQIRITEELLEANIILEFMSMETLQVRCETDNYLVVGCGSIDYFGGGSIEPIIKGSALISLDENFNMQGTILHELLHAMGIFSHSPNRNDVMYFEEAGVSVMSRRDINTLRRLYEGSPSLAYGE